MRQEHFRLYSRVAMTLLLSVLTTMATWAQSGNWSDYKASAFSSINESAKTISITSEAELALLAYNTSSGTDYSGYTITLTKDLNMSAHYWNKTIGTSEDNCFRGTFNGANKTISGININSGDYYKGLFGFVGCSGLPGTIQNVTLATSTITGKNCVGGIVGKLLNGTVSNCHVLSSVSILASSDQSVYFGGIVGQTYPNKTNTNATIENCTSAASVTDNGHNSCSNFGGIVGYNYYYNETCFSTVTGCFYYGTAVSASSNAGAIVGSYWLPNGISNCYYNCPSTISGIGYNNTDIGTTRVYKLTLGTGTTSLNVSGNATYTHNGTRYYTANSSVTVATDNNTQVILDLSATSGTISNLSIASDKHSATFTIGSSDVTLTGTVKTISGTCGNNGSSVTWSLGGTNYTELTISGTGAMQDYGYTTVNSLWRTNAPWGWETLTKVTIGNGVTSIGDYAFIGCESLASITIGSGVTSIGIGAINHCDQMTTVTLPASVTTIAYAAFENCQKLQTIYINHDGEVSLTSNHANAFNAPNLQYIVFPSPVGALANTATSGNWATYKDKLRARFGDQLFTATNEGGTAAYAITNEQDLRNLATAVNAGNDGSGKTFRQTANITMSSTNFTPIGNADYFSGTYDGGGKAIIGLHINSNQDGTGLFRTVYGGKVKNLYLDSPNVNSSYNGQYVSVSAVVSYLSDASTIENCYVVNPTLTISTSGIKYYGVIASGSSNVENCISNCYFYDSNTDHNYKAISTEYGTITNVGRAYTLTATSPATASATKAFTYASTDYYTGTVTLSGGTPHTNGGWVDTYTVNGTAIEGNTFSLTTDATVGYSSTPDATHFSQNGNEYTIKDATGWGVFCDLLEANDKSYFTGKTVVLDKDIAVTRMAGSTNHEFSGIFDGQTHTLTVAITGTVQGTAPFCEIKGATIRNLAVTGSVAGKRHSAGLVGFARGDNSVTNTIENCLVNTSVSITGDNNGYLGGIVGHGLTSALTIRGCAFTGSLTSTSNYTGGLQGWSDGNILTLQDDLFAPTSVSAANAGFHPVAFHNNNSTTTATVSNVYYTVAPTCTQATRISTANAAEQPKQQRSITAGTNVTIEDKALTGDETEYSVSGITAYANGGLKRTVNDVTTLYYGSGDEVSLTLSNTATDVPDLGYQYGYSASAGTFVGTTLTMPDADVIVSLGDARSDGQAHSISYMNAEGTTDTHDAIALDGSETSLAAGWYFVGKDIEYSSKLTLTGDVTIILCDGKTMSVGTSDQMINAAGIYSQLHTHSLTVYGQSLTSAAGSLNVHTTGAAVTVKNYTQHSGHVVITSKYNNGIYASSVAISGGMVDIEVDAAAIAGPHGVTISGGQVTATGQEGINSSDGNIIISGGQVTATGTSNNRGIFSWNSSIILGWTNADDFIHANGYVLDYDNTTGTISIADGKVFIDEDNAVYSGSITKVNDAYPIDDKTLTPAVAVTLGDGLTATSGIITSGDDKYAKVGETVTVSATAPEGYTVSNVTVTPATGDAPAVTDNHDGTYSFTVPAVNVAVDATILAIVSYIDADGKTAQCTDYTLLTGSETTLGTAGQETWYVADGNYNYYNKLSLTGDVHLILCDGARINVSQDYDDDIYYDVSIKGDGDLTIYGQANGTGTLISYMIFTDGAITINGGMVTVHGMDNNRNNNMASIVTRESFTINGGTINTSYGDNGIYVIPYGPENPDVSYNCTINGGKVNVSGISHGINANGNVIINGGQVWATGEEESGIVAKNLTLSWTQASDYVYANSYTVSNLNNVTVAAGKAFTDNAGNIYNGTLNYPQFMAMYDNILQPAVAVTLGDGITAVSGIITSGDDKFAKVDETVTMSISVPGGQTLAGIAITPAIDVTDLGNGSYSFIVPTVDVSVTATFLAEGDVPYIDENGMVRARHAAGNEFTVLTGSETTLDAGWYVAKQNLAYNSKLTLNGDVNLILTDGVTMTVTDNTEGSIAIDGSGDGETALYSLAIYGQSEQSGKLTATGGMIGICGKNIYIHGGDVTAGGYGINAYVDLVISRGKCSGMLMGSGNITVSGGEVNGIIYSVYGDINISGGNVTSEVSEGIYHAICANHVNITGGVVYASVDNNNNDRRQIAISAPQGVTITGGQVTAIGTGTNGYGIITGGTGYTTTLGWTNPTDFIHASSYRGTVNIAQGQTLYDEDGNSYSGTIDMDKTTYTSPIDGKTLHPYDCRLALNDDADNSDAIAAASGKVYNVTLQGRTLWTDGYWNTICLPFDVSNEQLDEIDHPLHGTIIMELDGTTVHDGHQTGFDAETGTLYLYFNTIYDYMYPSPGLVAGRPYLVKWYDTTGDDIQNPVFRNVTVKARQNPVVSNDGLVTFNGIFDPTDIFSTRKDNFYLGGNGNRLYYPWATGMEHFILNAFRGYFHVDLSSNSGGGVRAFSLHFGDDDIPSVTTGIEEMNGRGSAEARGNDSWYTIDGMKLDKQPTTRGLYIHGGRKVIVK